MATTTASTHHALSPADGPALLSLVNRLLGYPAPDDDDAPGPWDPVIRAALDRVRHGSAHRQVESERALASPYAPRLERISTESLLTILARRHPELWDIIADRLSRVALNPQPLPPRVAFAVALADIVAARAELIQDVGEAAAERGIIIVGGRYVSRFVDDLCRTPFRPRPPKPRPWWFPETFEGADLLAIGARFQQLARQTASASLREAYESGASRLAETGGKL